MTNSRRFEQYIRAFSDRLKRLAVAQGAAAMAMAALIVSLTAVAIANRAGFPDGFMIGARSVLALALGAVAGYFIVFGRRRVDADTAGLIEARTPGFGGRVEAYVDTRDDGNPVRELLAEETLRIAASHSPEQQVAPREFRLAWSSAGIALAALLLVAIAGPGNYAYGVRDLWVGWAFPDLLPAQSIDVSPGDDGIRTGGTVRVRATMQGFDPREAWVHASFADGEWQRVPMSQYQDAFEFTFFSVRQPLEYYVSANNVRSPTFEVRVVDLPDVDNLTLTYHFPDWTGKSPEVHDPGGDIRAIAGTEVELRMTTDRPMTPGAVVIDGENVMLDVDGVTATARFPIEQDGQYYVAATVGGERIRLTDDHFITILDDRAPEIAFERPGRDWSASRIEEVTARVSAEDDFRIDSLELHFSVNGGDWQAVDLGVTGGAVEADHVFFLEALANGGEAALVPGDLVSYYAVATDRESSARTDMFFIDVQPFDRRYTQSQQTGGGQQGGPQNEVSERQREIIISTWNLIRERSENNRGNDAYVGDNAALLSRLQETLRGQVESLAQRAEARQLTATDEEIAEFVEHLRLAAEAMTPAAQLLAEIDLDQALLPEQEALQHLLAAEAVFTDINVSMQANRGGRGGQAGRDLTEMFELEMDLEKNQYETGSTATPEAPQQQMQEAADELAELARRQEQLARNRNRSQAAPEQRWQQEMLRREAEELQRRLEQLRAGRQQSQSQQGSPESGAASSGGEPSSSATAPGEERERELDELQRRLSSALRAMAEASEAMQGGGDPEDLQRAMEEAGRQLEGASDSASEAGQREMTAAIEGLEQRAGELRDVQAGLERQLQQAARRAMEDPDGLDSGLSWQEEMDIAAEKRELLAALQQLQSDAKGTAQTFDEERPAAATVIRDGIRRLEELEIEARIAVAAAWIEQGEAVYVASSESAVTEALRRLREDLQRARSLVEGGAGGGQENQDRTRQALAGTRALREALQQAAEAQAGGNGMIAGGPEDRERGVSSGLRAEDLDATALQRQAEAVSQGVTEALRELSAAGASPRDIDELRRLAQSVRSADFSGNADVLARETRLALSLAEQLELRLSRTVEGDTRGVRGDAREEIPEQHRGIVADYYRRLGQAEEQ